MTIEVQVRNNNVEKGYSCFKKKLLKDGMMRELKERQYYEKPTHVKRDKENKESLDGLLKNKD